PKGKEHLRNPMDKYLGYKHIFEKIDTIDVALWFYNELGTEANPELAAHFTMAFNKIFSD
ncbi:MAG: hypothetical protein R6U11_03000, partial [Bacteroidales bacterium]